MKKTFVLFIFSIILCFAYGETDAVYTARILSRMAEMEMNGALSLWITDCDTGEGIEGALVAIENVGSTKSDADGVAAFPVLEDGTYNFIVQHDDYVLTKDSFEIFGGSIFFNKYSIPKKVEYQYIKIILDWGKNPKDLDIHLIKENGYHISFRDKKRSDDGTVWLDRDDMDSFGPETITITELDNAAVYRCFVFNWSKQHETNGFSLSQSGARIRVYADNKFIRTYTVPEQERGGNVAGFWYSRRKICHGWIHRVDRFLSEVGTTKSRKKTPVQQSFGRTAKKTPAFSGIHGILRVANAGCGYLPAPVVRCGYPPASRLRDSVASPPADYTGSDCQQFRLPSCRLRLSAAATRPQVVCGIRSPVLRLTAGFGCNHR